MKIALLVSANGSPCGGTLAAKLKLLLLLLLMLMLMLILCCCAAASADSGWQAYDTDTLRDGTAFYTIPYHTIKYNTISMYTKVFIYIYIYTLYRMEPWCIGSSTVSKAGTGTPSDRAHVRACVGVNTRDHAS